MGTFLAYTADERVALIAAGATLAGVIVGGLITTLATAFFERRRERAELQRAKRLVAEEVRFYGLLIRQFVKAGTYPTRAMQDHYPDRQWPEYRATLAQHLDDDEWKTLGPFMTSLYSLPRLLEEGSPGEPIGESLMRILREADERATKVMALLIR